MLQKERPFSIGADGRVTMDGTVFTPTAGTFEIALDLLPTPKLPSAGEAGLSALPLAAAGSTAAVLSCAYLAARRSAGC